MARASGAVNPITNEVAFSDLGVTMTAHPVNKKPPVFKNEEAVKRAIKNLILTSRFERPYEPLYGCNIYDRLFENFDPIEEATLKADIEEAISNYEPRAIVEDTIVRANFDQNELYVTIRFRVVNQAEPTELEVVIQRIR